MIPIVYELYFWAATQFAHSPSLQIVAVLTFLKQSFYCIVIASESGCNETILVRIFDLLELFESMFRRIFLSYFEKVDHSPVHNKGPVYL